MYYFSIGAIFKNESHILKEWIEHYRFHNCDHIYLINDHSTDEFESILTPYINEGYVTLYNDTISGHFVGMQEYKYNMYFNKHLKESIWFGIFDLDEFLYSPYVVNIKDVLKRYEKETQLHINWVHFGSCGHDVQPNSVVQNFIKRGPYNSKKNGPNGRYNSFKSIVKTNGVVKLGIHSHIYNNTQRGKNVSFSIPDTPLLINHYAIQSKQFWMNVKMTRGDVNYYYDSCGWKRNVQLFEELDINDIEDTRLKHQNNIVTLSNATSKQKK
jgi:hypothetical protein